MKNKLFNSPFEMSLRVALLLSSAQNERLSIDRIIGLDFISCFAADFGIPYTNLHGDNGYRYGEIVGRRLLVQNAIKMLVSQGLINVTVDRGYLFSISQRGNEFSNKLETSYAREYRAIAKVAISKYKDNSDAEILATIQNLSIQALRG